MCIGRDIRVETVYKGYLYPVGHPAALVHITERIFQPSSSRGPMQACMKERVFIRVSRSDEVFPALTQPFAGCPSYAYQLVILTDQTPDLLNPFADQTSVSDLSGTKLMPNGRLMLPYSNGLLFWPLLFEEERNKVNFKLICDGVPMQMPLLFIDSTAAEDNLVLRGLSEYYNNYSNQ